jgi:hypothetical protein
VLVVDASGFNIRHSLSIIQNYFSMPNAAQGMLDIRMLGGPEIKRVKIRHFC